MDADQLKEILKRQCIESRELHIPTSIQELDEVPTGASFLRDFVATNTPVIIREGAYHWPAMSKWSNEYLKEKIGSKNVHVAYSPTGYADAEVDGQFILPDEREEPFAKVLDDLVAGGKLRSTTPGALDWPRGVPYLQFQNSSLEVEYSELMEDVEVPEFAKEAFGCEPEVRNLWLGPDEAVTSMHKDPYENLYAVVRGQKVFTLCAPTDLGHLVKYAYDLPVCEYKRDDATGEWAVKPAEGMDPVRWIPREIDVANYLSGAVGFHRARAPEGAEVKEFEGMESAEVRALQVRLGPGDMLYLPAHWYHGVRQKAGEDGITVAVNFWWDAKLDARFALTETTENLSRAAWGDKPDSDIKKMLEGMRTVKVRVEGDELVEVTDDELEGVEEVRCE